jgi:hypothetical protein
MKEKIEELEKAFDELMIYLKYGFDTSKNNSIACNQCAKVFKLIREIKDEQQN